MSKTDHGHAYLGSVEHADANGIIRSLPFVKRLHACKPSSSLHHFKGLRERPSTSKHSSCHGQNCHLLPIRCSGLKLLGSQSGNSTERARRLIYASTNTIFWGSQHQRLRSIYPDEEAAAGNPQADLTNRCLLVFDLQYKHSSQRQRAVFPNDSQ
jgi:hypothetical protein